MFLSFLYFLMFLSICSVQRIVVIPLRLTLGLRRGQATWHTVAEATLGTSYHGYHPHFIPSEWMQYIQCLKCFLYITEIFIQAPFLILSRECQNGHYETKGSLLNIARFENQQLLYESVLVSSAFLFSDLALHMWPFRKQCLKPPLWSCDASKRETDKRANIVWKPGVMLYIHYVYSLQNHPSY